MHSVLQDIVFGLRLARRHALVTAVTIVTMMLGVGVSTAIFSVVNAAVLRSAIDPITFATVGAALMLATLVEPATSPHGVRRGWIP